MGEEINYMYVNASVNFSEKNTFNLSYKCISKSAF